MAIAPYIPASTINSTYGKPNAAFSSMPSAGVPGSSGAYGTLPGLIGYSTPQYNYANIFADRTLKTPTGKASDAMAQLFGQERRAGVQENAARGQAILQGYEQRIGNNRALGDQQMGMVDAYGQSQQYALDQLRQQQLAKARQSALKRGLGNTTIQDSLDRGVNADYARSQMQLQDQLLQNRVNQNQTNIGTENQLTGDRLGFLSSIKNEYPTLADISNLYLQGRVAG